MKKTITKRLTLIPVLCLFFVSAINAQTSIVTNEALKTWLKNNADFNNKILGVTLLADGGIEDTPDNIEALSENTLFAINDPTISTIDELLPYLTGLFTLNCAGSNITALDLSENTKLKRIECYENKLTTLDLSNNTELEVLNCFNNSLSSLDISNNIKLTELRCYENQLTTLDVTNNTVLMILSCKNNKITTLTTNNNPSLQEIHCEDNSLSSLGLSSCSMLRWLYCSDNNINSLTINSNELSTIKCNNNNLSELTISSNELHGLFCDNNQLTTLDISSKSNLAYLSCENNLITSLAIANKPLLEYAYCANNLLTELNICYTPKLHELDCTNNPHLTTIYMTSGQDSNFDVFKKDNTASINYIVEKVTLNKSTLNLKIGDSEQLTATITPADATNKNISWSSSDTNVATVDGNGNITAIGDGLTTVTAKAVGGTDVKADCLVSVSASSTVPVTEITLNKTEMILNVDSTELLIATISPANATNKNVSWSSSDPTIAKVSETGLVTAITTGTSIIIVSTEDGGKTATCKVTVNKNDVGIDLIEENQFSTYINNNLLIIKNQISQEIINIYTIDGTRINSVNKDDYIIGIDASNIPKGIFIVTGSSGWTKKLIKQ